MKKYTMKYFFNEDVLFIPLCDDKSPVGDEDFQENVVLYKDTNDTQKVVSIEILNFSNFKEDKIKIGSDKTFDFTNLFKPVRMFLSLRDIMFDDPEQFEETLKIWGFKKVSKKKKESNQKDFILEKSIPALC